MIIAEERKDMRETGIKPAVLDEIRGLARQYGIEKVILFGSRARGDFSRISDIDLAVQGGDCVGFALDLEEKTSTLSTFDVVDLTNCTRKEFADTIRKEGIVIYKEI